MTRRYLIGALLFVIAAMIAASYFRVGSAEFGLQGRTDFIAVDLATPQESDAINATEMRFGRVRITTPLPGIEGSEGMVDRVIVTAPERYGRGNGPETLTLDALAIPARWTVKIKATSGDLLRIIANPISRNTPAADAQTSAQLPIGTKVVVWIDGEATEGLLTKNSVLAVQMASIDVSLRTQDARASLFPSLTPAGLTLQSAMADAASANDIAGTLQSGSLWVATPSEKRELGPLNRIAIAGIDNAVIRSLRLDGDALEFAALGRAATITDTPVREQIDLRPTILDALASSALFKAIVALLSFAGGIGFFKAGQMHDELAEP